MKHEIRTRSSSIRYLIAHELFRGEHVDIAVVRTDSPHPFDPVTRYELDYGLAPNSSVDPMIFTSGSTATFLKADFDPRTRELRIHNIERRALAPGQAFARHTLSQLLALTPGCDSIVLANITNATASSAVERCRAVPGWHIAPEGALLSALHEAGFVDLVGFGEGQGAYRNVRGRRCRDAQSPPNAVSRLD